MDKEGPDGDGDGDGGRGTPLFIPNRKSKRAWAISSSTSWRCFILLVVITSVDSQAGHNALGEPLKGRKMLVNEMLIRYLKGTEFD